MIERACRRPTPRVGFFITGTDTAVGKTVVTATLTRLLRQSGQRVRVCKPVATGAELHNGRLVASDTRLLAEAAADADLAAITPWPLPLPTSPPVAARAAAVTLTLPDLVEAVVRRQQADALLLVEGVGGLLCPLTEEHTVADLAEALGLPLLVVARRSLGTLNHTLLTLELARARSLPVAGVVLSECTPPVGIAEETNPAELRRLGVPLLAVLPYQESGYPPTETLTGVDWLARAKTN
jgi:dethiobiotin synthetase